MPVIERPNRDALRKALDIYYDAIRPFIVRILKSVPGQQAEDLIANALRRNADRFWQDLHEYDGDLEAAIDTGDIPEIIRGNWREVFSRRFSNNRSVWNAVGMIRDARNDGAAHWRRKDDLDAEEVRARLTDIAKVLGLINTPEAKREVENIRNRLFNVSAYVHTPEERPHKPAASGEQHMPEPSTTPELLPQPMTPPPPAPVPEPLISPAPLPGPMPRHPVTRQVSTSDRDVLVALYKATNGDGWANNQAWLSNAPLSNWHGVITDNNGRVTELDLSDNKLSGEIPADLGRLDKLELLSLRGNQLTGRISDSLCSISVNDVTELGLPLHKFEAPTPTDAPELTVLVGDDEESKLVPPSQNSYSNQQTLTSRPDAQLDLSDLNEQQRNAVTHGDGPLLIFAGPGTGKTRVITYRVANLIASGVAPWNILAVTFTNKAASEMRERIVQLVGRAVGKVNVGTFHGQALHILRGNIQYLGREPEFTVYDASDQLSLIRQVLYELNIGHSKVNPRDIQYEISRAKDSLHDPATYANHAQGEFERLTARIYLRYQQLLESANGVDFGDMLFLCLRIFRDFPEVLAFYQDRFRFILVDEYQDINYAQYEFIREIAASRENVCVVGDDDQNIYSWRGADIRYIREFEAQFPDAATVRLERNYRSTKNILACANAVISKLADRVDKTLWTEREDGERLAIIEACDEEDEAMQVAKLIRDLHGEGVAYRNIAVAYRANAQSRPFEESFHRRSLPYRLVKAEGFYDRPEVRSVLAYLRATANPRDSVSFEQIATGQPHNITRGFLQDIGQRARRSGCSPGELARQLADGQGDDSALLDLGQLLRRLDTLADELPVSQLIDAVVRESGYGKVLNSNPHQAEERWDNIRELMSAAAKYDGLSHRQSLERFLSETALLSTEGNVADEDAVSLLTAHASKGLEFGVVIVVGLEEGLFPDFRSFNDAERAAGERRLAYVALTRAEDRLFLSYAQHRSGRDAPRQFPSRFLDDIPAELRAYRRRLNTRLVTRSGSAAPSQGRGTDPEQHVYLVGQRVRHESFGEGRIVACQTTKNGDEVAVRFAGMGGTLNIRTASLRPLS